MSGAIPVREAVRMTRYADPTKCPDCGATLPPSPSVCPSCELPLTGPLARTLFQTLQSADQVLLRLRESGSVPQADPVAYPTTGAFPATPRVPRPRRRLSTASVPKILLGLGALCLLVAALTFLAVAWSALGVGGRTAVLVALTGVAGGLSVWLARRGLRMAAEALTVVSFGLLTLDLFGAEDAGWFGEVSGAGFQLVVGLVLTATGAGTAFASRRRSDAPLLAPQAFTALGAALIVTGAVGTTQRPELVFALATVVLAAGAVGARRLGFTLLSVLSGVGSLLTWLALAGTGLVRVLDHLTVREMWLEGNAWPLTVATLLVAAPAFVRGLPLSARNLAGTTAASLAVVTVIAPALDNGADAVVAAWLIPFALAGVAQIVVPQAWRFVPTGPLLLCAPVPFAAGASLSVAAITAVDRLGDVWTRSPWVSLPTVDTDVHPAFLLPITAALVLAVVGLGRVLDLPAPSRVWVVPAGAFLGLAALTTLTLYAVPLVVVVTGLVALACGLVGWALPRDDVGGLVSLAAGGVLALMALATALVSVWLTAGVLVVLVVLAALLTERGRHRAARTGGEIALPVSLAGLIWTVAEIGHLDEAWRAVPVLLVVGALAVATHRLTVEIPAVLVGTVSSAVAVAAAADESASLALHLTLAGVLVVTTSLVNDDRRMLGWVGGLLLAAATWVRLADIGVTAPEPYTMPSAVALIVVGLLHMRRTKRTSSMVALGPGLTLATVPSLLWVLDDPVSVRAALLGVSCLVLVLAGTRLRWSAPLVIGAVVGGLVVLREAAPYAGAVPQWVIIGLAGVLLTVVGVTWERRLAELRRAGSYLAELR